MERRWTNGFTLVEMLVVMVIAGILIGLSIPAVTSLMSSGGVGAGAREVANTLNLARQVAITQRTYARVVFQYSGTVGSVIHPDMQYRAYAVMTNRNNSATPPTPWVYMTKWEYLPLGAVFLQTIPGGGLGALDDLNSLNQAQLPFPSAAFPNNIAMLAYIEFGPTGAGTAVPPNSATSSTLAITEGFTTVNGNTATPRATAPTKTSASTLANLTTISVDPFVGRVQVAR